MAVGKSNKFKIENNLESDNFALQGLYIQTPSYDIKIGYACDYAEDKKNNCIDMSMISCTCELRTAMRYTIGIIDGEAYYDLGSWQASMFEKDTPRAQRALDIAVDTVTQLNDLIREYFEKYSS